MELQIKPAAEHDAEIMAQILTEAMQYKLAHGDKAWGDEPYTPQELQKPISEGKAYIAWLDGKAVGAFILTWDDEMIWGQQPPVAGYVHQLAVSEAYHGQKIGEQLLDWADKKVAEKGRDLLRLDTKPYNTGLKTYYEKLGFRWVKDREVKAPQQTYTAALYERRVK